MNIDFGLGAVIVAVLIFYLRLIIIQRERAKRLAQVSAAEKADKKSKTKKGKTQPERPHPGYSIISPRPLDRAFGLAGVFAIILGILLNIQLIPLTAVQPYWWVPTALGVIAFSWVFKL